MKKVLFLTALLVVTIAVAGVVSNELSVNAQAVEAAAVPAGETVAAAVEAVPAAAVDAVNAAAVDVAAVSDVQAVGGGQNPNGGGNGGASSSQGTGTLLPASGELSSDEAAALLFMVEEEKLARDVYTALYASWGVSTFQSIAASEQAHMDSLAVLLDRYGLTSPVQAAAGVFTDPGLQALYTALVARGSVSLSEALKVGAEIEEIDILDLQSRLALTDNADIQQVFNNLLRGSENHLRSYVRALSQQTGETYVPQHLSADAYAAILAGTSGNGNSRGGQGGQGGQGGGYRGGRP